MQISGCFIEGKRHDARIFVESGLQEQLQLHSYDEDNRSLCIYGDAAYPVTRHVQCPLKGANLTEPQKAFNTSMSRVRVAVEWPIGGISTYFAFVDLKKTCNSTCKQLGSCILLALFYIMLGLAFMVTQ